MRTTLHKNRDYYPQSSNRQSSQIKNYSSSSSELKKIKNRLSYSQISQRKYNNEKSRFENRLQKACNYDTLDNYKKQSLLLRKQIQRLQRQNLKKDKQIFEMQSLNSLNKQIQMQLQQTYRIIYLCQGKIQQFQRQIKKLQQKLSANFQQTIPIEQIQKLLNEYRHENITKNQQLQDQIRINFQLQNKLKNIQLKYFQTSWKLSNQIRQNYNPLKIQFPKLRNNLIVQDLKYLQKQQNIKKSSKDLTRQLQKISMQKFNKDHINEQIQKRNSLTKVDKDHYYPVKDISNMNGISNVNKIQNNQKNISNTTQKIASQSSNVSNKYYSYNNIKPLSTFTIPQNQLSQFSNFSYEKYQTPKLHINELSKRISIDYHQINPINSPYNKGLLDTTINQTNTNKSQNKIQSYQPVGYY